MEHVVPIPIPVRIDAELAPLIPAYLDNKRRQIDRFLAMPDAADKYPEIQRFGHNLRGTGSGYGFPELTLWGEAIEMAARNEDRGALREALHGVQDYLSRIVLIDS